MNSRGRLPVRLAILASTASLLLAAGIARAQTLSGTALVQALRHGGYVIVIRHANSPRELPDQQTADPANVKRERQLDATGRASAIAMGNALRRLKIPIGEVLTSPTYRARETAQLAQLPHPQVVAQLDVSGRNMHDITESHSAWLRRAVTELPAHTDTVIVTQSGNMEGAFPQWTSDLAEGEALIFGSDGKSGGSDGKGGSTLLARVKIEEWPKLKP